MIRLSSRSIANMDSRHVMSAERRIVSAGCCTENICLAGATKASLRINDQWRSQECELGGLPSLDSFLSSPSPLPSPSLPLLTGVRGITPGNSFEIKGARRSVLEHLRHQN